MSGGWTWTTVLVSNNYSLFQLEEKNIFLQTVLATYGFHSENDLRKKQDRRYSDPKGQIFKNVTFNNFVPSIGLGGN